MTADDAEHLRRLFIQIHNPRVKRHFANEPDDDIISSGPASLKAGCTIQPKDNLLMVISRVLLFEVSIGNASRMHPAMYALPVRQHYDEEDREGRPKILLYFSQDVGAAPNGFSKIDSKVSFRLGKETNETITETKAIGYANKIKSIFGSIPTYDWTKGKTIYSYIDKNGGYHLQIYASSEAQAKGLIIKVLEIQNHSFDDEFFHYSDKPGKSSINNPSGTRRVYGKSVRKKRWRPTANVRFRYATLNMDGVDPVVLYDPYEMLRSPALIHR